MPNTAASAPPLIPVGQNNGVINCVQSGPVVCLHKNILTANTNATDPALLAAGTGDNHGSINLCPIPTGAASLVFWAAWLGSAPASDPVLYFYGRLRGTTTEPVDPILAANADSSSFNATGNRRWLRLYKESSAASSFTPSCASAQFTDGSISYSNHLSVDLLGCDLLMAVCQTAMGANPTAAILQGIFVQQ